MSLPITPLKDGEIRETLSKLDGWELVGLEGGSDQWGLKKTLHFKTFPEAVNYMVACVPGIEERGHHPIWTNKYTGVTIVLTTFDVHNKVTARDVDLAHFLDHQAQNFGARE